MRLCRRRRVDHAADFGDFIRREAAAPGMLANDLLVACQIDAKGLVGSDIALDPLDVGAEFFQCRIRLLRGLAQSLALGAADRRQFALDDEFAHRSSLPRWRSIAT